MMLDVMISSDITVTQFAPVLRNSIAIGVSVLTHYAKCYKTLGLCN